MNNSLSLIKIINGLSKTLTIANKVIPLYKEVKPYINKTNTFLSNINKPKQKNTNVTNEQPAQNKTNNLPTFFQ
jgi:hypothetical protein